MLIYNVTVKVDNVVHDDWKQWMEQVHIPDVMATGYFESYLFSRVISLEDQDGVTYSIQYRVPDMASLHKYRVQEAPRLMADHQKRYAEKCLAFRSILDVVKES